MLDAESFLVFLFSHWCYERKALGKLCLLT
jgi:hypothetical protein